MFDRNNTEESIGSGRAGRPRPVLPTGRSALVLVSAGALLLAACGSSSGVGDDAAAAAPAAVDSSATSSLPQGAAPGRLEWFYLNTTPGELEVLATVADSAVVAPVAVTGGGFRLFLEDGTLRSYDSTGALTGEIDTGLQWPGFPQPTSTIAARSEDDRLVAFGNSTGVVIVDTTTGTTTQVPTFARTESLLFAREDSLLLVGSDDGTVRAWDVERNISRGVLWRGPTPVTFATWYDDDTDSLWIAEEERLLELPLNPAVYLQRACEVVDRDLTQDEWDQYVPGGGPVQSACT